jgi:hypothetical protein
LKIDFLPRFQNSDGPFWSLCKDDQAGAFDAQIVFAQINRIGASDRRALLCENNCFSCWRSMRPEASAPGKDDEADQPSDVSTLNHFQFSPTFSIYPASL